MNKLVSKNPVQRFKQGKKIQKAQGGWKVFNTKFDNYYNKLKPALPKGFQQTLDQGADLLNQVQEEEIKKARASYDNQIKNSRPKTIKKNQNIDGSPIKNKQQELISSQEDIKSKVTFTPGTFENPTDSDLGKFTQTGQPSTELPVIQKEQKSFIPGTFNSNFTYNTGNIRANRGNNYSNVDEYWNYLNNNKDSNDYKLFQNVMKTVDGNLNRDTFNQIMSKYGISGNLGRRDSGRLANLLNDLNLIGIEGSDARNSFIDSYNKQFDASRKQSIVNIISKLDPTKYNSVLDYLSKLKQGGNLLPSRNIVERFKQRKFK